MKPYYYFAAAGIIAALSFGCKKDPIPSIIPEIRFDLVTPSVATVGVDSIFFTIHYTDGDGDIGENTSTVANLFLKDHRDNYVYTYHVNQLGPDSLTAPMEGNLRFSLDNPTIKDGSQSQQAAFDIYLIDRAGHISNVVTSTPVAITN